MHTIHVIAECQLRIVKLLLGIYFWGEYLEHSTVDLFYCGMIFEVKK